MPPPAYRVAPGTQISAPRRRTAPAQRSSAHRRPCRDRTRANGSRGRSRRQREAPRPGATPRPNLGPEQNASSADAKADRAARQTTPAAPLPGNEAERSLSAPAQHRARRRDKARPKRRHNPPDAQVHPPPPSAERSVFYGRARIRIDTIASTGCATSPRRGGLIPQRSRVFAPVGKFDGGSAALTHAAAAALLLVTTNNAIQ